MITDLTGKNADALKLKKLWLLDHGRHDLQ